MECLHSCLKAAVMAALPGVKLRACRDARTTRKGSHASAGSQARPARPPDAAAGALVAWRPAHPRGSGRHSPGTCPRTRFRRPALANRCRCQRRSHQRSGRLRGRWEARCGSREGEGGGGHLRVRAGIPVNSQLVAAVVWAAHNGASRRRAAKPAASQPPSGAAPPALGEARAQRAQHGRRRQGAAVLVGIDHHLQQ